MERAGKGRDLLDRAMLTLAGAENFLKAGFFREVISDSFLAMLYAARAMLQDGDYESADWRDVVQAFQSRDLAELGMSNAGRRVLIIAARLYVEVVESHKAESDPETATACLEDARDFVAEVERIVAG